MFDKDDTGTISVAELKVIMQEQGHRLNEEELRLMEECSRIYEIEVKPSVAEEDKDKTDNPKGKKGEKEGKKTKTKKGAGVEKKSRKSSKGTKDSKILREEREALEAPKDIRVDYKGKIS